MGVVFSFLRPRLAPKDDEDEPDSFIPPTMILRYTMTPCIKKFSEILVEKQYTGAKKILVYCTSKKLLKCSNGKYFNTGHQTSEIFVPLYHLDKAGFTFDFVTMDGGRVALEDWTYQTARGYEDKLREICSKVQDKLDKPFKTSDVDLGLADYLAVFLPGGHGPLIEGHKDATMGEILRLAHERQITTMAICHGPSVLRSSALGGEFPYKGYKMCVFPDKMDNLTPRLGYLPGWLAEEDKAEARLKELGVEVVNTEMDDKVQVDRELITGASQQAAQIFAEVCVKTLLEKHVD